MARTCGGQFGIELVIELISGHLPSLPLKIPEHLHHTQGELEVRLGTTRDPLQMADWLAAQGVTNVAMESTGLFWKPIFNILESRFRAKRASQRSPI